MTIARQLATRRLVVFLGTGGVGKTTIAAASALQAARMGRRTLVLTIDPARRLADSLGVKMGSEAVRVRENLDAMMLDTKAALDALVTRHAKSPETLRAILASRFYEQLSDAFAGSEEFVAMGALHDLLADGRYDVIVVDTPPSSHAVEFLKVNRKLIRVYESGVVKYLFRPTRFLRVGGGGMARVLARWTTSEYVQEFGEFMTTFDEMFADMEARVRRMDEIVTDPSRTSLNLVATAEEESVPNAARLYREVVEGLRLPVSACVVNRAYPRLRGMEITTMLDDPAYRAGARRRLADAARADDGEAEAFLRDAVEAARFYDALATDHERYAARLREGVPVPSLTVPAMPTSVHDLAGLERVREALFGA
ncbi:MAG TPA: ArsA-related P-loop ATPase [Candidatus Thermoplasmatota archaeon]|nr:ArsA-related P-loop ATPase [Candidatus Thermoplasmatota archaeon]